MLKVILQKKRRIFPFISPIDQGQSSTRELKNENHFLKDYVHRLSAVVSEYQTLHPPDALKKDANVRKNLRLFSVEFVFRRINEKYKDYQ